MGKEERAFIRIYGGFMEDEQFDSRDHFIYAVIKGLVHQRYGGVSILSTDLILATIGFTVTSRNKAYIKDSIQKLSDAKLIDIYKDFQCEDALDEVPLSNTFFCKEREEEGHFMKLYHDDFYKFLRLDNKYKMKIFTMYYNIVSKIYDSVSSDGYTMIGIEDIVDATGINRKTVPRYTTILMEEELMYCKKVRVSEVKEKNIYGRWENKSLIEGVFGEKHCDKQDSME